MPAGIHNIVITTCQNPPREAQETAKSLAEEVSLPYVARRRLTLSKLRQELNADLLVVGRDGIRYAAPSATFSYHPGMARVRLSNIHQGRGDPMVEAMGLEPGATVLDCTLGLATDAAVASYVVGEEGKVVGVEKCLPVYVVVREGLAHYPEKKESLREAMRRIEVHWADCADYLKDINPGEFEVIYFDPFFEKPVEESSGIAALRLVARSGEDFPDAALEEARIKAGRRVVMKGRCGSPLLQRYGVQRLYSGRRSRVEYGVIETA